MLDAERDCNSALPPHNFLSRNTPFSYCRGRCLCWRLRSVYSIAETSANNDRHGLYLCVLHLDPSHSSILPDLLARVTKMPLCVAQDQMVVEPNHVYVIPPNADLILEQGTLRFCRVHSTEVNTSRSTVSSTHWHMIGSARPSECSFREPLLTAQRVCKPLRLLEA